MPLGDHFLNLPFDLSRVLFIATANRLDQIPGPLRDRMETVRLSGYSQEEKVDIASRFLIPRQIAEHGLSEEHMNWSAGAIEGLVSGYTLEAGVRNLERQIAGVCRKVARKTAEGDASRVSVTRPSLLRYLGPAPHARDVEEHSDEVGVVKGLAWTEAGGELLPVEASLAAGRGLVLTGQMGDVMKESGQTALSFARTTLRDAGSEAEELAKARLDSAVHVPMSSFNPALIPTDTGKKVVFVCAHGQRSEQISGYVVAEGILTEAYNMAGGLAAWAEADLPLATGPAST